MASAAASRSSGVETQLRPLLPMLRSRAPAVAARLENQTTPVAPVLGQGIEGVGLNLDGTECAAVAVLDDLLPQTISRSVPERRRSFVIGRLCAELALARLGLKEQVIGIGARGEPIWPPGCLGSITRHSCWAGAVAARSESPLLGLGIDAELLVDGCVFEALATVCCNASERRSWLTGSNAHLVATTIFSAKESLFKAVSEAEQQARVHRAAWSRGCA